MATYTKSKYDIGLLRSDGSTKVGFMLAQRNGAPLYSVFDDEYLAAQFFTGVPGYGSLPAEKEIAMRQDDWRSGFGLEHYDSADPKRYYSSIGMDMRHRGMAIAGWATNSIAVPMGRNLVRPTATADPASAWTDDAATYDATLSSFAFNTAEVGSTGWSPYFYLNAGSVANCSGAKVYVGRSDAVVNGMQVGLYNGSVFHTVYDGDLNASVLNTWVSGMLDGINTAISNARIRFYLAAPSHNAYINEFAFIQSNIAPASVNAFANFDDKFFAAAGKTLYRLNAAGDDLDLIDGFPEIITALEPFTDNRLYIGQGNTCPLWYMSTSNVIDQTTLANTSWQFLKTVHTTTPTLYGNDSPYTIRSSADPVNTVPGDPVTVGSSYFDITDLISHAGALYMMKEDMPYYLDSSGNVQNDLAPELASEQATTSGKNAHIWQNKLYIPAGDQTLIEYDAGAITYLNPSDYSTGLSKFVGRVQALASDGHYLFAVVDNGMGEVEILAGRWEVVDGTTKWVWHPISEITHWSFTISAQGAFVSTVVRKALWIAPISSTAGLYYMPLPVGYGNVTSDTNRNFKSGGYMWTPWLHGNFRGDDKAFIKVISELGHTYNDDVYFDVHYRTLENKAWTQVGLAKGTSASMVNTLYIPADGAGTNPVSTMIQLNYCAITNVTTATPILLGYDVRGILYPPRRSIIACTVRGVNELTLKDGTRDVGSQAVINASLYEAKNATWPVTFYDMDGDTKYVKFLPLPSGVPRWTLVKDEKGRVQEKHYNLLLQEVQLS